MKNALKTLNERKIHFEARAKILKALAHPTRLFIVDMLSKRPHCVCELTELVGADMSTVSKHLLVLKNAGIIADEKRGLWVWYSLKVPCILDFMSCVEETIRVNLSDRMAQVNSGGKSRR